MTNKAASNAVVTLTTFYSQALAEAEARADNAEKMLAIAMKQGRKRTSPKPWRDDLVRAALEVDVVMHGQQLSDSVPFLERAASSIQFPILLGERLTALIRCASVYRERQAGTGTAVPESTAVGDVEPPEHPAR